jgi:8-oxo-dGTP pyrophosphatase MutT (NUDIX family)
MSSKQSRKPVPKGSSEPSSESSPTEPRRASRRPAAQEVSAGGVVLRDGQVLVIVPTRRAADGSLVLGLPKGHLDEGETMAQAAMREVREETGVTAELLRELGELRYWYVRDGRRVSKTVFFYLFRYLRGDPADHDDEVLEARWMPIGDAQRALSYPGEREMLARALAISVKDR